MIKIKKFAVTITRQFGSLGRLIAKRMSELLNIEYYDRDIVDMTAKKLNLPVSEVIDNEESAKSAFFKMRYPFGSGTTQLQDSIYLAQQRIIMDFVKHQSCIVVGRRSDYILQNMENCINIFIYAPYEQRLRNCIEDHRIWRIRVMKMKKLVAALLSVSCAMCFLGGCGSTASTTGSDTTSSAAAETVEETGKIAEIKKAGVLVMGTASGYPPYEFVSMENGGKVIGIDVAFGQVIADELGVELKAQDMVFSELITSLAEGKCDIAIAGMKETEERAKTIDFSDVYITDAQCMIIRKEDADKYTNVEDFTGKRIGVEMGSSSEELAKTEIPEVNLNSLSKIADLFMELKNGKIDGIVTSRVVGRQYVLTNDDLVTCDTVKFNNSEKKLSCGIAKGDDDLVELVNEVIKKCQDDGSFDKWIDEYSEQAAKEAQ